MRSVRGFTLIELMVVMSIIGLFSTVAMSVFSFATEKARDAIRVNDVGVIARALIAHDTEYDHWIENGYGEHNGSGYINIQGSGVESLASRLVTSGVLNREPIDPSGAEGSPVDIDHNGYMKYHCGPANADGSPSSIYVYARLESEPLSVTATNGTCCPDCDEDYNMNYYQFIPNQK